MGEAVTQQHGYFHAGATSAIAGTTGGYAGLTLMPEGSEVLTVEYKVSLVAPAIGDELGAVGTVVKPGRTLAICRLDVFAHGARVRKLGQQTLIRVEG